MALSTTPQVDTDPARSDASSSSVAARLRILQPLDADAHSVREVRRSREINLAKVAVAIADSAAFVLAMVVAYWLTSVRVTRDPASMADYALVGAVAIPLLVACLASRRVYQARFVTRRSDEFRRIADGLVLTVFGMVMTGFLLKVPVSRTWIILVPVLAVPALSLERELVRQFFRRRRVSGRSTRRVVIVGNNGESTAVRSMLDADRSLGYDVVAVVEGDLGATAPGPDEPFDLVARTVQAVRRSGATGVVVTATAMDLQSSNRLIRVLTHAGLHVELTSALSDVETSRISVRPLGRYPVLYIEPVIPYGWRPIAKRCFDVTLSALALTVLAVPMAVVALAVKCTSPGPVLFRQQRLGRGGDLFEVLKFRSMVTDAEKRLIDLRDANEADGPLFKMADDPRVTRVGRFIRRTSIDELPQLWNVVKGEMSLVGPRPALPEESNDWSPVLFNRLRVRPGITGMWQVSGRSDTNFDEYTRLDLYYVDNWSLIVDIGIVLRTIPSVLAARGAR